MARWLWEGSEEDIWTRISEKDGKDLTDVDVELQFRADHVTPDPDDPDWFSPSDTVRAGGLIRAAKLITGTKVDDKETKYRVWVKLVDSGEEYVLLAGFFTVR